MRAKNYNIDTSFMSIRQLKSFFATALKAANDRIKTLTKPENITSAQAYKYDVEPLRGASYIKTRTDKKSGRDMTVFTQPKAPGKGASKADQKRYEAQLREAVSNVKQFLAAKTSTVSGINELKKERRKMLDDMINATSGTEAGSGLSDADKDAILRWMGSPDGKDAMSKFDSHQVREAVTVAIMANRAAQMQREDSEDVEDGEETPALSTVEQLYNEFESTQQTLADWIYDNRQLLSNMGTL